MKASEILRGARELLSVRKRWTKGVYARDAFCVRVNSGNPSAVSWCLRGAINKVSGKHDRDQTAASSLLEGLLPDGLSIADWQDRPERTHAEVLDVLDRAIALAEREEAGHG